MRNTLKILPLMLGIMLFFTQCEKEALDTGVETMDYADQFHCNGTTPLYAAAGQNIIENGFQVGIVEWAISDDGEWLYVRYKIDTQNYNGWSLTETHLWVGDNIANLPNNAPPGQLGNSGNHYPSVDVVEYVIDISGFNLVPGDELFFAAHGVVVFKDEPYGVYGLGDLENKIPQERVTFRIQPNRITSYHHLFLSEATEFFNSALHGEYESYCADPTASIAANKDYTAKMYSSLSAPQGLFPSEKYNELNWLINNVSVNDTEVNGVSLENPINYADIQLAIWELLYGTPDFDDPENWINGPGLGSVINASTPENISAIVSAANENSDFVPKCGEYLVIFLVDLEPDAQSHLIWKPINCFPSETAWAFGDDTFIEQGKGNKWGWIYTITKCHPPTP